MLHLVRGWPGVAGGTTSPSSVLDLGPLHAVVACLWAKMLYFSLSLRSVWWAPEEPLLEWVRTHPDVFTATLASVLLVIAPVAVLPSAWRFAALLVVNALVTVLVVADVVHVGYYGDFISFWDVARAPMLGYVLPSVWRLIEPWHGLYGLDLVAGVGLLPFYVRAIRRRPMGPRWAGWRVAAGLAAAGLLMAVPTSRLFWVDENGVFAYSSLHRDVCGALGVLPCHLADAALHLVARDVTITEPQLARVRAAVADAQSRRRERSPLFGAGRGRNLVIVMVESLHAFPLSLRVHGQAVAPRLSELARESLHFVNFHDQTHLGTTADAEFVSLQSLHPLPVGAVAGTYFGNRFRALPSVLAEHGYRTLSLVGEPGGMWNMDRMHPRLGFQRSLFENSFRPAARIGAWLADGEFLSQALDVLGEQPEPFMAYLVTSSNHHPWEMPPEHRRLRLGTLEGTLIGNYLQSVHYTDRAVGDFVDGLRRRGLLDRSIVVVYGDHQAFLSQRDLAALLGVPEWTERHYFTIARGVPLLVRLPRGQAADVRNAAGGHLDIAPTLLALLGIEDESAVMLGRDLTGVADGLVVFRDGSFTDGRVSVLNRFGPSSRSVCRDVATGARVDCGALESRRRQARDQLEVSDLVVRGDLIPRLSRAR